MELPIVVLRGKIMSQEILINAIRVSENQFSELYEFVLNEELRVVECIRVESLTDGLITPIDRYHTELKETLFELNHVRVNPRVDNSEIIGKLTGELKKIGVNVSNTPSKESMALCFKPLGEISDNVRFYFHEDGKFIFLSPSRKLKVITAVAPQKNEIKH